jgi:SAM-dependent methyltransferase
MKDFWDKRYAENSFAYGVKPNVFFKQELDKLTVGSILLAAEGEGRNAVYALQQGWVVKAFDYSPSAKLKAEKLAQNQGLQIDFEVSDVLEFDSDKKFDVIGFSYAHFPEEIRKQANQQLLTFLRPNGTVIFEAFSKNQLGKPSGGPKNAAMLFSIDEIKEEFEGLRFKTLEETSIQLDEGEFHQGEASVVRFVGKMA